MLKEHEERSLEGEYKALAYDLRKQKERDLGIIDDEQEDKNVIYKRFSSHNLYSKIIYCGINNNYIYIYIFPCIYRGFMLSAI